MSSQVLKCIESIMINERTDRKTTPTTHNAEQLRVITSIMCGELAQQEMRANA